jgi:hypothetical protein
MFHPDILHPDILRTYTEYRSGRQLNALDSCTDTADYHDISVYRLAQFLVTMGIDSNRLHMLA